MDNPEFFTAHVNVGAYGFVSFEDLAPVLDELSDLRRHNIVRASVADFEPPAAGFSEIAVTIATDASATILATLALQGAGELRRKLLQLMGKARKNRHGRRYLPLSVEIGRVRFYFQEVVSEEALLERLQAAQEFAASLPGEAFLGKSGPGVYGLFWDDQGKTWRGSIYGYSGDLCSPEHMLSDNPGNLICIEH
jgi:hypothetical protein